MGLHLAGEHARSVVSSSTDTAGSPASPLLQLIVHGRSEPVLTYQNNC